MPCRLAGHFDVCLQLVELVHVLLSAAAELGSIVLVGALVQVAQVVVVVAQDLLVVAGQHQHGDGGAMVTGALQVGQRIHEQQTGGDGAGAVLQTLGVTVAEQTNHIIDDLLQRLDGLGQLGVILGQSLDGGGEDIVHGGGQNIQLLDGLLGEAGILGMHLLADLLQVGGIVTDALEAGDGLQQHIQLAVVGIRLHRLAQTDQEVVSLVAELIQSQLILGNLGGHGGVKGNQLTGAAAEVGLGHGAHEGDGLAGLSQSNGGRDVQILAQTGQLGMACGLLGLVLDDGLGQGHQQIGHNTHRYLIM